jgi:hypothetical protein
MLRIKMQHYSSDFAPVSTLCILVNQPEPPAADPSHQVDARIKPVP